HVLAPHIFSDCDPGSYGKLAPLGLQETCTEGSLPPVTLGRVYTRTGPCTNAPDLNLPTGWQFVGAPDAEGNATVTFPDPNFSGSCAYLGASITIAGKEIPAVAGLLAFSGGPPCTDNDEDGFLSCQGDCNDNNAAIRPGAVEAC